MGLVGLVRRVRRVESNCIVGTSYKLAPAGGGIYGDYYIFFENWEPYSLKTGTYNLSGIWINGNSGEIKEIKTDKNIKVILEPNGHIPYTKRITKDSK